MLCASEDFCVGIEEMCRNKTYVPATHGYHGVSRSAEHPELSGLFLRNREVLLSLSIE